MVSLEEGFGVGFRWAGGGGFPVESNGKGEGGGQGRVGGCGGDWQRNRQVNAQALSKLPFSKLPFSFSSAFGNHPCANPRQGTTLKKPRTSELFDMLGVLLLRIDLMRRSPSGLEYHQQRKTWHMRASHGLPALKQLIPSKKTDYIHKSIFQALFKG